MNKLVLLVLILFSYPALAGTCDSISCTGKIENLYPNGSTGKVYIKMDADTSSLQCTLDQGAYIVLREDSKLHGEIYSMLLAAIMANRELRVRIYQNTPDCALQYTQLVQQ